MADDDRRPPQAYDTMSPAGVGTTTTNQVSPGSIQEILDTGDRDLIDQALEQMGVDDLTAYLQSLPSPSVPAGQVKLQEPRRPMGLEHPIVGVLFYRRELEPLKAGEALDYWPPPALVEVEVVEVVVVVVVVVDVVPPVEDRDEDEDEDDDVRNDPPPCLGLHPNPRNKAPLEVPGPREDPLEPWVKRIYNDAYA